MTVTYIIHKPAGKADITVTVTGEAARRVLAYQGKEHEVGITILEVKDA